MSVEFIGNVRSDHFTMNEGATSHIWPSSQRDSRDMLADDWELLASPEYQAYVPGNFREAFDIVLSMMSNEVFEPYEDVRKSKSYDPAGIDGTRADCDWREMGKECLHRYMEAASAKDRDSVQAALARACISSLKALSYQIAVRTVEEVMRG